jgi:beta-glucosidase
VENAFIGTTQLTSYIEPLTDSKKDKIAAQKGDALFNRLFLEPSLGMGYPVKQWPYLKTMDKIMQPGDIEKMKFDFDFIGLQYYFRTVVKSAWIPFLGAKIIPPGKRNAPANEMDGEIYPDGLYQLIKQFSSYKEVKQIIITENGTCVNDQLVDERINDPDRVKYFEEHLQQVLRAKADGMLVNGYFVWSLTDNFEWDKGFRPRFGLYYVDYKTQKRYLKDSAKWFSQLLK